MTENGYVVREFITKASGKKDDGHGASGKKKKSKKKDKKDVYVKKLGKSKKNATSDSL